MVPFPFLPELSEGWERRADGLRRLTEYLGEYDIKLYLYINEPRAMPVEFFADHPELKGAERSGFASLCTSVPEIRDYLYDMPQLMAAADLVMCRSGASTLAELEAMAGEWFAESSEALRQYADEFAAWAGERFGGL